jgi:hypothetical protein
VSAYINDWITIYLYYLMVVAVVIVVVAVLLVIVVVIALSCGPFCIALRCCYDGWMVSLPQWKNTPPNAPTTALSSLYVFIIVHRSPRHRPSLWYLGIGFPPVN